MTRALRLVFVAVGSNPARLFGADAATRARRFAADAGLDCADDADPERPALAANLAFACDPAWFNVIAARPATVLTLAGCPLLAYLPAGYPIDRFAEAARVHDCSGLEGLELVASEQSTIHNAELRKRERPFVMPLEPGNTDQAERAYYDAAYEGVTDALTLYVWRKPAFYLTRWAAEAGLTPNLVTTAGALLSIATFWLFWTGLYWPGVTAGLVFMVLATVDGNLARCTGSSSKWGNVFDHSIELIHPPLWWWAWAHGLAAFAALHPGGRALEPVYATMVLAAIIAGYIGQRVIEGMFIRRFRFPIDVWTRLDSQFRLVTAGRNPNMVILVAALLFGRPDVGLQLVALWTILSLILHAVRLAQANSARDRGTPVQSWLAA